MTKFNLALGYIAVTNFIVNLIMANYIEKLLSNESKLKKSLLGIKLIYPLLALTVGPIIVIFFNLS